MRGNPRRLPSRKNPQPRRAEKQGYVNEDVYPEPTRAKVDSNEAIIRAREKRGPGKARVAHDYNPFSSDDNMAKPDLKVKFIPSKHQQPGYDATTMKDKPNMITKKLGFKKVQGPQIYLMEGEDMFEGDAGHYYQNTIDTYDHRDLPEHQNNATTYDREVENPHYLKQGDFEDEQREQLRHDRPQNSGPISNNGVQTYKVLTEYTVEVDEAGIKQNIYDARKNVKTVNMDQIYSTRSPSIKVQAKDESGYRDKYHEKNPMETSIVASRNPDGSIKVYDNTQFTGGWDEYHKEEAQKWAEGRIWNVKTSSYEPQYLREHEDYKEPNREGIRDPDYDQEVDHPENSKYYLAKEASRERSKFVETKYEEAYSEISDHRKSTRNKKKEKEISKHATLYEPQAKSKTRETDFNESKAHSQRRSHKNVPLSAQRSRAHEQDDNPYDDRDVDYLEDPRVYHSRVAEQEIYDQPSHKVDHEERYNNPVTYHSRVAEQEIYDQPTSRVEQEERYNNPVTYRSRAAGREIYDQPAHRVEQEEPLNDHEYRSYLDSLHQYNEKHAVHMGDINPFDDWKNEIKREKEMKNISKEARRRDDTWAGKVKGDRGAEYQDREIRNRRHGLDTSLNAGIVHDSYQEKLFGEDYYQVPGDDRYREQGNLFAGSQYEHQEEFYDEDPYAKDHDAYADRENVQAGHDLSIHVIPRGESKQDVPKSYKRRNPKMLQGVDAGRKNDDEKEIKKQERSNIVKVKTQIRNDNLSAPVSAVVYDRENEQSGVRPKEPLHESKFKPEIKAKKEKHGRYRHRKK